MSLEAYIWTATLPLSACSATPYRVLLMLADRADPLGYCAYPSVRNMAETLECSTRTVQRALRELEDVGLIRKGDQRPVQHYRPDKRPVVYDVLTTALVMTELRAAEALERAEKAG